MRDSPKKVAVKAREMARLVANPSYPYSEVHPGQNSIKDCPIREQFRDAGFD
jgi:hypothetical protein